MPSSSLARLAFTVLLVATPAVAQEPSVQLPFWQFKANGTVAGPVIATEAGELTVAVLDATFDFQVPIRVRGLTGTVFLEGTENTTYFTSTDCGGNAWIQDPSSSTRPVTTLTGRSYTIAAGSGGDLFLYRSNGASGSPTINSRWQNGSCSNTGGFFGTVVPATPIVNITTALPTPYTLE